MDHNLPEQDQSGIQGHQVTDAGETAPSYKAEDVAKWERLPNGDYLAHLKDGTEDTVSTPKKVTHREGSETVNAALAFARKTGENPDDVYHLIAAAAKAGAEAGAKAARGKPDEEDGPEADPVQEAAAKVAEIEQSIEEAVKNGEWEEAFKLNTKLAKAVQRQSKIEAKAEKAQERQTQQVQSEAEQEIQAYEDQAHEEYPELENRNGKFRAAVIEAIESSSAKEKQNPALVLLKTQQVARRMGIVPAYARPSSLASVQTGKTPSRQTFTPPGGYGGGRTVVIPNQKRIADADDMDAVRAMSALKNA